MRVYHFKSIQNRILFSTLLVVFLMLVIRSTILIFIDIRTSKDALQEDMELNLSLGESSLRTPLWDYNLQNIDEILDMFLEDPKIVQFKIEDENNQLLLDKQKNIEIDPKSNLTESRDIYFNGALIGKLTIVMSMETYKLNTYFSVVREIFFSLLEIASLGFILWFVSKRISEPIKKLTDTAERIASGSLDTQFVTTGYDEVGQLSIALETMQGQIVEHVTLLEQDRNEINALYEETAALNEELEYMISSLNDNYEQTIKTLANAIEANDEYTKGHCERVANYSRLIADAMELDMTSKDTLSKAAILHDIGKLGVPNNILNSENKLLPHEFELVKKHSLIGYQILREVKFLHDSSIIIRHHHEHYSGGGYPDQLSGEEIHVLSRILCIADAYDAMTSSRAYRKMPLTKESAIQELERGKGIQFDPLITDLFIGCLNEEKN